MKLTLTKLFSKEQISKKTNKPFTSLSIKTKEHGDRFLSGFGSKETQGWREGDVIELDVTESDKLDKLGKPYLNWKLPNREDKVIERFSKIEFSLAKHDSQIRELREFIRGKFQIIGPIEVNKLKEKIELNSDGSLPPDFDVVDINADLETIYDEENGGQL